MKKQSELKTKLIPQNLEERDGSIIRVNKSQNQGRETTLSQIGNLPNSYKRGPPKQDKVSEIDLSRVGGSFKENTGMASTQNITQKNQKNNETVLT